MNPQLLAFILLALCIAVNSIKIHEIQGPRWISPFVGKRVFDIEGVVTAIDLKRGFYMQSHASDNDTRTSEGIFVYSKTPFNLTVGDAIVIGSAFVDEYKYDMSGNSMTQLRSASKVIVVDGARIINVLDVVDIPSEIIFYKDPFDTSTSSLNVDKTNEFLDITRGLDYFESHEGMLVNVPYPIATSKAGRFGTIWVVANKGEKATGMNSRGGITISKSKDGVVDMNPERFQIGAPFDGKHPKDVVVGDELTSIQGIVEFSFGNWRIRPLVPIQILKSKSSMETPPSIIKGSKEDLTIATYNVENLNAKKKTLPGIAAQIVEKLNSPDIIALQEIQDDSGAKDDGTVTSKKTLDTIISNIFKLGGPNYEYLVIDPNNNEDGGKLGGNIRPAFLFNPQRVSLSPSLNGPGSQSVSQVITYKDSKMIISHNPCRIDPSHQAWHDSRKPLSAVFEFGSEKIIVINTHAKSKYNSSALFGTIQPPINAGSDKRVQQGNVIREFVDSVRIADPDSNVVVLGDFNDVVMSQSIQSFGNDGEMVGLLETLVDPSEQYSYVFEGNSQAIDHVFVSKNLVGKAGVEIVHVNTWTLKEMSDHDPIVARVRLGTPGLIDSFLNMIGF